MKLLMQKLTPYQRVNLQKEYCDFNSPRVFANISYFSLLFKRCWALFLKAGKSKQRETEKFFIQFTVESGSGRKEKFSVDVFTPIYFDLKCEVE